MKRKWDMAREDVQRKCVDEVIARVEDIGNEGVGIIAAQDIIDIVTDNLGPAIYNAGLRDARKAVEKKLADLEADIQLLEVTD